VLTVGSPYGFEASVSAGIVSARPRAGAGGPWGELLQTDAAVNPGSAGGPLVNARGELIGFATITSPRGSSIGFAVPSNVVRKVFDDVLVHGRVVRGWLGIGSQAMTAELARGFRAPFSAGLLLTDVVPGGPAARAGLTRGSIVLDIDGRPLRTTEDLDAALAATSPGRGVALHVWSGAQEATLQVVLAQEPSADLSPGTRRWLGLVVEGITPDVGVVVTAVQDRSPALAGGVLRGDVIRELDRRVILTLADFDEASEQVTSGRALTLLVQRGRYAVYLVLTPEP
jgi:serine protease Do